MTVLYRKYRPQKFKEIVGQDHIIKPLLDSIESKRIAHAYLFSGSRGTGKTSTARILAQALKTAQDDIYEIDAASNRGIDDIRHLREHVSVLPFTSTFKVYIIDEVHMLSKDAWNALLKTLEEPPAHVIFILATTEIEKVPDTIISRCQTFVFHRPSREVLRKEIMRISKEEGYELDHGAGELIALLGDGSFRDALGILEKVLSSTSNSKKKISREEVENMTGAPRAELVNDFISNYISKNVDEALKVIGKAEKASISMNTFLTLVLEKMRFILLLQHSSSSKGEISERTSPDDMLFIEELSNKKLLTPEMLALILGASAEVARAHIETLPVEMAVVRNCA